MKSLNTDGQELEGNINLGGADQENLQQPKIK